MACSIQTARSWFARAAALSVVCNKQSQCTCECIPSPPPSSQSIVHVLLYYCTVLYLYCDVVLYPIISESITIYSTNPTHSRYKPVATTARYCSAAVVFTVYPPTCNIQYGAVRPFSRYMYIAATISPARRFYHLIFFCCCCCASRSASSSRAGRVDAVALKYNPASIVMEPQIAKRGM